MTVRDMQARLQAAGIERAAEEALLLAAHMTGRSAAQLRQDKDRDLDDPDGQLQQALARREAHYPLQYLLGTWGFWRQEYEVSPDCLIPRSDTEVLVEYAVRNAPRGGRILDLCTGSGCIAISLLCEREDLCGVAVDLFDSTLALAKRNAVRNGVDPSRLTLLQGDVLQAEFLATLGTFDMILSNPPYIPTATVDTLAPELSHEPRAALDGGKDGLMFYRRMLRGDYRRTLRAGGSFVFEIGFDQADALRMLAGRDRCDIIKDLGGCDRVAVITPTHIIDNSENDSKE